MIEQFASIIIAAGLSGIVSAIATVAALKVEMRALRRDVDRHDTEIRELRNVRA